MAMKMTMEVDEVRFRRLRAGEFQVEWRWQGETMLTHGPIHLPENCSIDVPLQRKLELELRQT